ncbi:MAG: hypothetical protein ACJ74H_08005, partial [Thermoanaerobaculia bacterium]
MTALARFVLIAFIVALLPLAAHAQTCTPPTIAQIGGLNPSCAGSPVTLDAGDGWVSYAWSNGATTRTITDTPLVTTTYTVTVTDALGCSVTSAPLEVTTYAVLAPPAIQTQADVCPGSNGYADASAPPDGTEYTAFEWSITNGTIVYGGTSANVSFTAGQTDDVELSLTVTDQNGCQATSTTTIALASIPPPQLDVYEPSICPGPNGLDEAYVAPPPAGINYSSFEWLIVNGTIQNANTGASVVFKADGNGPVELTLVVRDDRGCESTNSISVPIRTIPPPQIDLYQPSICPGPNGNDYAIVAPPPAGINYVAYQWSIINGTIEYSSTGSGVVFHADGNGPVELTVVVRDDRGCESTKTVTVPLGAAPPPITIINPNDCSIMANRATIDPSYTSITWSVTGATILSGQGTNELDFAGNGNGGISVSVTATDSNTGCAGTNTVSVPASVTPIPILAPETACVGSLQKVTADTINGQYSFNWTITNATVEGPTDQHELRFRADGTGPVTVSVTALEYGGCPTSNSVTIPLGPMPAFTLESDYTEICPDGSVNARVSWSPGDVYGSYQWTVQNGYVSYGDGGSQIWLTHQPGTGDVTLTLTVGEGSCTQSSTLVFPVRPATDPIVELSSPTLCEQGTGTLYFDNASSFSGVYVYAENGQISGGGAGRVPGGRSYTYQATGGGNVTLHVYGDQNGCTQHRTLTATVAAAPAATITPSGPTTFCQGGTVTLTASAGSGYLWSNGATTQSITVSQAGVYTVTVSYANGCTRTASRSVFVQPLPDTTITPSGPTAFCQGGSVTLTAPQSGNFLWSTGATTRSITVSTAGTYSVTITSGSCSKTSDPVVVTVNAPPAAGIHSAQIYDDNGSGTVTRTGDNIQACGNPTVRLIAQALDPSFTYSWSTGANTALIDVTTSGTYSVTVTTPSGCSTTSSVNVTYTAIPPKPTIATTGTELCPAGGSVTLTAPSADSWTWSNGATSQSIVVTEPGSYTVRVRNGACDSPLSDPVVITTGLSTITTNDSLALCGPGGSATLTANAGTSWLWSNGATTQSIVVTAPGTFTVTTTNLGCTMPESAPVTVTARAVTIDANGPTSFCAGGSVTLTASDGTSWLWSNGATTRSITVSQSGSYGVTATYTDGCSIAATPVVVEARQVSATVVADATTVCTNGAIHLSASASGGSGYTYQWYDNTYAPIAGATAPTLTINPSASGFVYVKVTDGLGCVATSNSAIYSVVPTPDATITTAAALCEGQSGSASVADAGPGAAYSWTITNGTLSFPSASSVTFTPNGLDPVTLNVTITNAGCSVSSSKSVTINALPVVAITPSGPTTFCAGGSVTLTASAGASYLWSNGATSQSINVTATGEYSVIVTNANGCSATSASTSVTVNAPPAATITASGDTTFCEGQSVTLTASAGSSYLWSNGATTPSINVTATGEYTVIVTNASGCSATSAPQAVTVKARPQATITPSGALTFCTGQSVTLTANPGASYVWSNGATSQSIDVFASDNFQVTVTYANGCSSTSTVTSVTANPKPPTPSIGASGPTTFCAGGSVTLSAPAGYASYLWSTGEIGPSISVSTTGNYSVTVTNASGCSTASPATSVTVNAATSITAQPQSATIPRNTITQLSVTATGTGPLTYQWYKGTSPSTAQPISGATGSTYTTPKLT